MSNQLVKIEKLPLNEIMSIGKAFAESGLFPDVKTAAQAIVKIQAGMEIGIPPFASMSGIHLIQGKPAIGAGLMASRLKGSGKYDYRVVEQTEKLCSIDFFQGKQMIGNSTFTAEDAKKAQTKNMEKFPRNMLFARAMSNGIKWYAPDIFSGPVYTPEELGNDMPTEDVELIPQSRDEFLASWKLELDNTPTKSQLLALYDAHKETVDQDVDLKNMFGQRQTELNKTPAKVQL